MLKSLLTLTILSSTTLAQAASVYDCRASYMPDEGAEPASQSDLKRIDITAKEEFVFQAADGTVTCGKLTKDQAIARRIPSSILAENRLPVLVCYIEPLVESSVGAAASTTGANLSLMASTGKGLMFVTCEEAKQP